MTPTRQKIVPHLWFHEGAEEAAEFYTSLFPDGRVGRLTRYADAGKVIHGRETGSVMTVEFELAGFRMIGLNGGPHFDFDPSISFFVTVEEEDEVDRLWNALSDGGTALMPLDAYDWSPRYGWMEDRYGVTWQISQGDPSDARASIVPALMFVTDRPVAQAAMEFYTGIFPDAEVSDVHRYPPGTPGGLEGGVMHGRFRLAGQPFTAMDAAADMHSFAFSEAISLLVECDSQEEVDHYWNALNEGGDPSAQQCGWLKDAYGVSWQIYPTELGRMLQDPDPGRVERVTEAFMKMKKLDVAALRKAHEG